jgi:hypothetical protein
MDANETPDSLVDQTLIGEIELLGDVVAAAAAASGELTQLDIDAALGLATIETEGQ